MPDVIVIGAGVLGSSIALELSKGGRSVLVLDAGPAVGAGSTSSSSAIIRFHYSTLDSVLMAWEAAALWHDLEAHLGHVDEGGLVHFVPTGALVLDWPDNNRATVLAHFDRVGIPYEELTADQIRRKFPLLDTGDFSPPRRVDDPEFGADAHGELGGYYEPSSGFIDDPMRAAANFMAAARHHGADLRLNAEVVAVRSANGRVVGITLASGEEIDAAVVVNVAGPASSGINRLAGVTDDMRIGHRALRQEVFVAEAPAGFGLEGGTLLADIGLGTYFRPHLGGTLLIGGTEPECDELEWIDDPSDFLDRPTVDGFERTMYRAARRMPELGIPHRPVGLAALYDASDDWVPIYDRSSLDGFYMACGSSGNQFKNAPMSGIVMAALIDAVEAGHDHDGDPVKVVGPRTGETIDLGAFSRRRERSVTSGTVMG